MFKRFNNERGGCVVGCLIALGIFILIIVIIGAVLYVKRNDILNAFLDQVPTITGTFLTDDHTDQEKAEFIETITSLVEELKTAGVQQGIENNQELVVELQSMVEDQQISREETLRWLALFEQRDMNGLLQKAVEMQEKIAE